MNIFRFRLCDPSSLREEIREEIRQEFRAAQRRHPLWGLVEENTELKRQVADLYHQLCEMSLGNTELATRVFEQEKELQRRSPRP